MWKTDRRFYSPKSISQNEISNVIYKACLDFQNQTFHVYSNISTKVVNQGGSYFLETKVFRQFVVVQTFLFSSSYMTSTSTRQNLFRIEANKFFRASMGGGITFSSHEVFFLIPEGWKNWSRRNWNKRSVLYYTYGSMFSVASVSINLLQITKENLHETILLLHHTSILRLHYHLLLILYN